MSRRSSQTIRASTCSTIPCTSRRLSISATAGGSVVSPGEGQFGFEDGETVRLEAMADPGFKFVGFSGTYSSSENPAFITMDRDHDIQANFVSELTTIHVDDDAPGDAGPRNPQSAIRGRTGPASIRLTGSRRRSMSLAMARRSSSMRGPIARTIDLLGKRIELTGFDPDDPDGAAWPVIDGGGIGPIVSFTHNEGPDCLLTGLVITGGKGRQAGAIRCTAASPTDFQLPDRGQLRDRFRRCGHLLHGQPCRIHQLHDCRQPCGIDSVPLCTCATVP